MCDKIQKCCRICLDVETDHLSILEDPTVLLHLKACLGISVSAHDELPKGVCIACVSLLSKFYNFQLNARCSQDWLESSIEEKTKKSMDTKTPIQPLPDSEYNSDSLLEFLNNTANIEEYLNNLGKEDIPSIVNMLDRNQENSLDTVNKLTSNNKSPKKKEMPKQKNCKINMEIDVLDSELEIVKEILMKETDPRKLLKFDKGQLTCFAYKNCLAKFDNLHKLAQHLSVCDFALRTCIHCDTLFDSKLKMQQHSVIHSTHPLTCTCGKQFTAKEKLLQHYKVCHVDYATAMGCVYRCKQCSDTFKDRFQLYRHAKLHILKSDERVCDVCGHSFIGDEALSNHKKNVHGRPDDSIHRCKICSYTSPNRKEIYLHVQRHIARQELERHLCETCGRSFATRATLLRHSSQHRNVEDHCNICNKTFTDIKMRDRHVLEHTEMAMCDKCGQNVNSYKLDAHSCG